MKPLGGAKLGGMAIKGCATPMTLGIIMADGTPPGIDRKSVV